MINIHNNCCWAKSVCFLIVSDFLSVRITTSCIWTCWSWRRPATPGPLPRLCGSAWPKPWQLLSPQTPSCSYHREAFSSPRNTAAPSRGQASASVLWITTLQTTMGTFGKAHRVNLFVSVLCSVLSVYEAHQKLLDELRGAKREAENGWRKPQIKKCSIK